MPNHDAYGKQFVHICQNKPPTSDSSSPENSPPAQAAVISLYPASIAAVSAGPFLGVEVRRPFTTAEAFQRGMTESTLKWAVKSGSIQRIARGVYLEGGDPSSQLERVLCLLAVTDGVACGSLAAALYELDSVPLHPPYVAVKSISGSHRKKLIRRTFLSGGIKGVEGYLCTNGVQTLTQLAATVDDLIWEQALESALRKQLLVIADLETALSDIDFAHKAGLNRIRRVLALRPSDAPPTESLLETLMVQLIRKETSLPAPMRQVEVRDRYDQFVARIDLAWPEVGLFLELDGQHHKDQPVYDARRETAVVATKGWLPGRFTWHEVTRASKQTATRVRDIYNQAIRLHKQP